MKLYKVNYLFLVKDIYNICYYIKVYTWYQYKHNCKWNKEKSIAKERVQQ